MNVSRENTLIISVGAVLAVAFIGAAVFGRIAGTPAGSESAPVATATVEPDATVSPGALALAAADKEAQTQATAIAQSAAGRAQAAATTRRAYAAAVQHGLQRYADALGRFRDSNRQVAERPAVMQDPLWRAQTRASLATMHAAAGELTAAAPVPADLVGVAELLAQVAGETASLSLDAVGGTGGVEAVDGAQVAAGRATIIRLGDLLAQANRDVRSGGPATP